MTSDKIRQWVNVVAVVLTLTVNGLANALPLNGLATGEISDRFKVFFVPAGYVFAIWGIIYIGLVAYAIYQALPSQRTNPRLQRIGYLFALSSAANIAWLFLWHYEVFPLTIVAMLALLASLIAIYLRLDIGRSAVEAKERWTVDIPFSIYLGWITVATIANATSLLDYLKWDGWGLRPEIWAVVMLIVATLLAAVVSFTRADVAYLAVLIWAFAGIAVKHMETSLVANAAWGSVAAVAVLLIAGVLLKRRRLPLQVG